MKLTDKIRLAAPIFFLKADNICDKIPLLSTLTNLVDLIAKGILLRTGTTPSILGKSWSEHISHKPIWKCLLLCIPVLGNIIVYFIPHKNHTQEVINGLFGKSKESFPELKISKDEDVFNPANMTSTVMKGNLSDGRPFIAIHLKHNAEPCPDDHKGKSQTLHSMVHPECFDFEKVYGIYQRFQHDPNIWCGFDEHNGISPYFFGGSITDVEEGYVRGFEQQYYDLLKGLIKNGTGKDTNGRTWTVVNHSKFKQDLEAFHKSNKG